MGSTVGKVVSSTIAHTYCMMKRPKYEGEHFVKGIHNDVKVVFDKHGTCHIYAKSGEDAIFAQGFYTAQERLFILEMLRRFAKGTVSEIVKTEKGEEYPPSLGLDKLLRTFGFLRCARREMEMLCESDKKYIKAFLDGINTYLKSPDYIRPVEMFLGNLAGTFVGDPEPYTLLDFLSISRFTSWTFGKGLFLKVFNTCIKDEFGVKISDFFSLSDFSNGYLRMMSGPAGSNGLAVSGKYTKNRYPILEGDPHLATSNPSFWLRFHLVIDQNPLRPLEEGIDVNGLTVVGGFGVQIGQNGHCSFTATVSFVDHVDIYLEKKLEDSQVEEEENRDYFLDCEGYYVPCEEIKEEIQMLGHDQPYVHTVQITQNGPIISGVLNPHSREYRMMEQAEEEEVSKDEKKKKKYPNRKIETRDDVMIDGRIRRNKRCVKEDPERFEELLRTREHSGVISFRSTILEDPEDGKSTNMSICSKLYLVKNIQEFIEVMRESHYINAGYTYADRNHVTNTVFNDHQSFDPSVVGNIAWVCSGKIPKRQTEAGSGTALLGYDKKQQWVGMQEKQPVIVNPKQGYIIGCNNDVYRSFGIQKPYFTGTYFLPEFRASQMEEGLKKLIGQGKRIGMDDIRNISFDTQHPSTQGLLKILDCFLINNEEEEEEEGEGEEEEEEVDPNYPAISFFASQLRTFDGNFRKESYLPSLYISFCYGYLSTYWTCKNGVEKENNEEEDPFEGQLYLHLMGLGIPAVSHINLYAIVVDCLVAKIHESLDSRAEKREMVRLSIIQAFEFLENKTKRSVLNMNPKYFKDPKYLDHLFQKYYRYGNIHRLRWKHNLHDHVYGFDVGGFEVGGWKGTPYQTFTNYEFNVENHPSSRVVVDLSDPKNLSTCIVYPGNSCHVYSPFYQLGAENERMRQKGGEGKDFPMWSRKEVVDSNSYGVVMFKKKSLF